MCIIKVQKKYSKIFFKWNVYLHIFVYRGVNICKSIYKYSIFEIVTLLQKMHDGIIRSVIY